MAGVNTCPAENTSDSYLGGCMCGEGVGEQSATLSKEQTHTRICPHASISRALPPAQSPQHGVIRGAHAGIVYVQS